MRFVWVLACLVGLVGMIGPAAAQNSVWIQIEAHRSQAEAEARARAYAGAISPLEGYRLRSGWHALAIGPLSPAEAATTLRQLRVTRQIPGDSYLVDGAQFRQQFWPPEGQRAAAPLVVAPPPPTEPADETPAEARRAEAQLTRAERQELQAALAWEGFYDAAIDGAFGRGTRAAMADWQLANGHEPTGILTTAQRAELLRSYRAVLEELGMAPHLDARAGIEIDLPLGVVALDRVEPPFVHFTARDGGPARVVLISMSGDRATLGGLYDVMQTLDIVPLDGPRQLRGRSFELIGENDRIHSETHVELAGDEVKGFTLVWPAGDDKRRARVIDQMRASFRILPGSVLPDGASLDAGPARDLLAGLSIRRPSATRSGFFVSADGHVVTLADAARNCDRITLGDDTRMTLASATDGGLALLAPQATLRPLAHADLAAQPPAPGAEVAVAGYSFGGRLGAPTLTFGTFEEAAGLNGEADIWRLSMRAHPGDAGGPVLDAAGGVLGVLLPSEMGARLLPPDVQLLAGPGAIGGLLESQGIVPTTRAAAPAPRAPEDLAHLAADMTVLVQCWN